MASHSSPEHFVVNIGDLMRRWTNDRWLSNLHRVVNPPHVDGLNRPRLAIVLQPSETTTSRSSASPRRRCWRLVRAHAPSEPRHLRLARRQWRTQGIHAESSAWNVGRAVSGMRGSRKVRLHPIHENVRPAGRAAWHRACDDVIAGEEPAMNVYLDELIARERIADARAEAAQLALVQGLSPAPRRIRVAVGRALIRVGHWVAGREARHSHPRRVMT